MHNSDHIESTTKSFSSLEMTRLYNTSNNHDLEFGSFVANQVPLEPNSSRIFGGLRKQIIAACVLLGVTIITFSIGRTTAPSNQVYHGCDPSHPSILQDSVAPEGPVSMDADALYDYRGRPRAISSSKGVVAADHGRCSELGLQILKKNGGNAVDAVVVTALCQGIYNPMASGIGGGHIMVIRRPDGQSEVINAREVAPLAANETMFQGRLYFLFIS